MREDVKKVYEVIRTHELISTTAIYKTLGWSRQEVLTPITKLWNANQIDREFIDGVAHWKLK